MSKTERLEAAVKNYEESAGLDAVNYRGLPKSATLRQKLEAATKDLRWWELHVIEVPRELDRAVGDIKLSLGL